MRACCMRGSGPRQNSGLTTIGILANSATPPEFWRIPPHPDDTLSKARTIMKVWFTADTHFGHGNIIKYCNRPFLTDAEREEVRRGPRGPLRLSPETVARQHVDARCRGRCVRLPAVEFRRFVRLHGPADRAVPRAQGGVFGGPRRGDDSVIRELTKRRRRSVKGPKIAGARRRNLCNLAGD